MARKYRYFLSKAEDRVIVQMEHGMCGFSYSRLAEVHLENTLSFFADNLEQMNFPFNTRDFDMSTFEEVFP